ncbi:MAG TPA: hypothetical protein DEP69_00610, partial [Acidimicrobiaceae bacterium]|nr:hypothetical protein [Acidimicrobiaceae bacterium]
EAVERLGGSDLVDEVEVDVEEVGEVGPAAGGTDEVAVPDLVGEGAGRGHGRGGRGRGARGGRWFGVREGRGARGGRWFGGRGRGGRGFGVTLQPRRPLRPAAAA